MANELAEPSFSIFHRGFIGEVPFAVCHQEGKLRIAIGAPWGRDKSVNIDVADHPEWDQLLAFAGIIVQAYKDIRQPPEPT